MIQKQVLDFSHSLQSVRNDVCPYTFNDQRTTVNDQPLGYARGKLKGLLEDLHEERLSLAVEVYTSTK